MATYRKYSVDFVCNDGSPLTKSMRDYTAELKINNDIKEIMIGLLVDFKKEMKKNFNILKSFLFQVLVRSWYKTQNNKSRLK